jgi:hypothetical protein
MERGISQEMGDISRKGGYLKKGGISQERGDISRKGGYLNIFL